MDINLHIERLVLDGVSIDPQQQLKMKESLCLALRQKLVSTGVSQTTKSNNNLKGRPNSTIAINSDIDSSNIGLKIGNAVHGSVYE